MTRLTNNQLLTRGVAGLAAVALTAGAALAGAAPVMALGTPHVSLKLLDTTTPGRTTILDNLIVDASARRGYLIDDVEKSVKVYDVSGPKLVLLTTITMGLSTPGTLAFDESTHRLAVGDQALPAIALIDTDPSSPTVNTVIKTLDTGANLPRFLALDEDKVFVGDFSGDKVTIVDVDDNSMNDVVVGVGSKILVADPATHTVYAALPGALAVASIKADGTLSTKALVSKPTSVAVSQGKLLVGTPTRIERYDPVSWAADGVSAPLPSGVARIAVDDELGLVYAVSQSMSETKVPVLRADTLAPDGLVDFGMAVWEVEIAPSANRLLALSHPRTAMSLKMYSSTPAVQRLAGADRFVVSAAISAEQFHPSSTPTVYVASGAVFADALAASAAAGARNAPVLLVLKDAVPQAIADELSRLHPDRIIMLGGTSTLDTTVETALKAYAPKVERISGADRYEVAAAISRSTFGTGVPVAYISSGVVFPDALSGSAVAGKEGGPVLLVDTARIPDAVKTELTRLAPKKIVVLGGPNSVAESVVAELTGMVPATSRITGADRFVVSAAISRSAFSPGLSTVYVASGTTFPDALSGSAAAIAKSAPVLLVTADTIPSAIAAELDRLDPAHIIVLGGTIAISDGVFEELRKYVVN